VSCWHGSPENRLYGVGGDKVVTHIKPNQQYNRPERWENDDEAFKKAFTDAVNNAFKFVGVAADIHMGQFDDSKYVNELRKEFEESAHPKTGETPPAKRVQLDGPYKSKTALWTAFKQFDHTVRGMSDSAEFEAWLQTDEVVELLDQCKRDAPPLYETGEGLPDEFEPALTLIKRVRNELSQSDESWRTNPVLAR
jgi:hypothetical protein